jgi:tape measure domain-containing protein
VVATVGSISIDLSTNVAKFASGFRAGATTVERESARMGKAASGAESRLLALGRAATGFLGGGLAARQIQQYADSWTSAGNQIRAAGEIAGLQGRSLEAINDIAGETRTGFRETVNLYARLLRAGKDVAKNEQEIATATEIVNKAFKAGGAAASEQAAGILQLGQALGSGVLQGDELRSLRENAPLLAQAIADEFGTTIGGLKDLGAAGVLTSERVFQAILKGQKKIDAAFDQTKVTISDAVVQLGNSTLEAVGKLDQATGSSKALTEEILRLATAIEQFSNSPSLDKFLSLFNIEIIEGGLTDQVRDFLNGLGQNVGRTVDEVKADIASVETVLDDLRAQANAGFDVELQTDRALEDLKALQDELARVSKAAAAAAANGSGSLNALAESALKALETAQAGQVLPTVSRYGGEVPEPKTRVPRQEVNGVGVTRFGSSTLEEDTTRTATATEKLAENMPSWLDELGGTFDSSIRSVNELLASGVFFDYASIADAVRTGIVSGMAQERQQYSISTTNPIQKQIEELQEMLEVAGSVAARGIREQIRELELQLYLTKQGRELGGLGSFGGRSIAYAGRFAEGGSFVVPGAPSGDNTRVMLDANGGERVTVSRDGEGPKPTVVINQTYQPAPGETERTTRQNMRNMTIEAYREVSRI